MISRIKWIAPVAALAALGACSYSYESGPSSSETRTFSDFDSVDASAGVNVTLHPLVQSAAACGHQPRAKQDIHHDWPVWCTAGRQDGPCGHGEE